MKTYGKTFDRLEQAKRNEALTAMQQGKAEFDGFDSKQFFGQLPDHQHGRVLLRSHLWRQPQQGVVAHARLPGLPAIYADKIDEYRNKRYPVAEPQSIADFQLRG